MFAEGGEITALRMENFVLRQQLSDSNETISELKKQIEAIMKHTRLSTTPWKESTTRIEHPSIGPGIKFFQAFRSEGYGIVCPLLV